MDRLYSQDTVKASIEAQSLKEAIQALIQDSADSLSKGHLMQALKRIEKATKAAETAKYEMYWVQGTIDHAYEISYDGVTKNMHLEGTVAMAIDQLTAVLR